MTPSSYIFRFPDFVNSINFLLCTYNFTELLNVLVSDSLHESGLPITVKFYWAQQIVYSGSA